MSTPNDTEVILLDEEEAEGGTRYEFTVAQKETGREAHLEKQSEQAEGQATPSAVPYVEPRMHPSDLVYFFDVNTWHRRCIMLKARLVAGLGYEIVRADGEPIEDADKQAEHYKALEALLENPQRELRPGRIPMTFLQIAERTMVDYYTTGNAYNEVPRNARSEVAELYHVRAATMRRDRDLSGGYHQLPMHRLSQTDIKTQRFRGWNGESPEGRNEVIHLMDYDPSDDYYGAPEWLGSLSAMLLDRTSVEYNTHLFRNGLMAHFVVVVEGGKLSKEQVKVLKQWLRRNATGIRNAGRGLVLQNEKTGVNIRIEKINVDFKSMRITDGRELNRDEVVAAHGVLPRMVGIMSAGSLGGGGEMLGQLQTFMETVIEPDQDLLENFYNQTIVASLGPSRGLDEVDYRIKFTELDIYDLETLAGYYTQALNPQTGWMRREEVREQENLPAEDPDQVPQPPAMPPQLDDVEKALRQPRETAAFLKKLRKELDAARS